MTPNLPRNTGGHGQSERLKPGGLLFKIHLLELPCKGKLQAERHRDGNISNTKGRGANYTQRDDKPMSLIVVFGFLKVKKVAINVSPGNRFSNRFWEDVA